MTKKQKRTLVRIIITFILLIIMIVSDHFELWEGLIPGIIFLGVSVVIYLLIAYDILWKAIRNICHGQVFDENFLMVIATFGAFGVKQYPEAVSVMLFYQIGELFQGYAVGKSRKSIADMMSICPEYANLVNGEEVEIVEPDEVKVGEIIVIKPGERIPLDGEIIEGESFIDTSALTGESVPRHVNIKDNVISGCINQNGILKVKVLKEFEDSTVAKILELVENASAKKAKTENFITRFAKWYTPIVTISALLLAVVPPLLFHEAFLDWLTRGCIFLVISCPCALVISVPLSFFGGIGAASKAGVLVKGSNYLEALAEVKTLVFDKTGTLTKGEFCVNHVNPFGIETSVLLETAAYAEAYSTHPIANSIRVAYDKALDLSKIGDVKEIAGCGVLTEYQGKLVLAGNKKLMEKYHVMCEESNEYGTCVYVASEGVFLGNIIISDEIKSGATEAIAMAKAAGIEKCVMLTGDRSSAAFYVKDKLMIDEVHAELLPNEKVTIVEELLKVRKGKAKLAFAGDGINDAPVLTRADVGIAMGSLGSDAAIEAADIVIMDDDLRKIALVKKIAKKTRIIVRENIIFALAVKFAVLCLGTIGVANMWEAVFADVGVSVIAILNAMRIMKKSKK